MFRGCPPPFCRVVSATILFFVAIGIPSKKIGAAEQIGAVKIDLEEKPDIDGDLSDPVWKKAAVIQNLTQMYPNELSAPSEKTEIRICFDSRNFYFSFKCWDRAPEKINASVMQRDQTVGPDDYIYILLDPYQTGREGFYFRLNANGAKGDGKVTGFSSRPNMDWDAVWDGDGKITEDGWTAEFAIPFRSISFDKSNSNWGANFGRWIPRYQERSRWSGAYRHRRFIGFEDQGTISGMTGIEQGLGVDFKPYALGRRLSGNRGDGFDSDYGDDVFWQVTPNLTTTLTWNTDFAETEVDDRVVNLTRFPLFFPEKRDFFLEGQEYFEFGPFSSSLRPFHSRTIGISDTREKVDIVGGAKVTGRVGKIGVGMIGTQMGTTTTLEDDQVGAARFTYDVLEESRIGTFFSFGDARENAENWVAGFDFDFKSSHWRGSDDQLNFKVYELISNDDADQMAHAFGANLVFPNEPFYFRADVRQIDEDFEPGLGFVRRPGTRRGQALAQYEFYPESIDWLREWSVEVNGEVVTNLENQIESSEFTPIELGADFENGDEIFFFPEINREVLFEPFEITDDVTIPVGDYGFHRLVGGFETSSQRPVSIEVAGNIGNFYNGDRWGLEGEIEWRQSKYFGVEVGADFDVIDLEGGEFEVLVGSAGFRVTPNPKLSWNTLVQWDSVTNNIGLNSRLRYIVAPGNETFLVVNQGYNFTTERDFNRTGAETIAKVGWTFRY